MRSIRLSLILYFVVLLILSLGSVSWLMYQSAQQSLNSKQLSMRELLLSEHKARCRRERSKLDEALLADARNLASMVKIKVQEVDWRLHKMAALGVLTSSLTPSGYVTSPYYLAHGVRGRLSGFMHFFHFYHQVQQHIVPPEDDNRQARYYQINTMGFLRQWCSPSMEDASFSFDPDIFSDNQLVDWKFDTVKLKGKPVRRVMLKVSAYRINYPSPWPRPPRRGPQRGGGRSEEGNPRGGGENRDEGGPRGSSEERAPRDMITLNQTMVIQAASATAKLEKALAKYDQNLIQELDNLEKEEAASMSALRQRLLLISLITFAVTVAGVWFLVRLGLTPLQRLSHAVSKVSENNIQLETKSNSLPIELRPIADRLNQTLALLKRAFAREKQAAADISHELRTPLAAMLINLEMGLRKPREAEEYRELLEECRIAGVQMTELVERMLALARLDAGSDHLRPREVDVSKLASQCVSLVRPIADSRGLSLTFKEHGPALFTADPDKLREVMTNLLHNAIEYNRPGGSVNIEVQRVNGHLDMAVSDTGIGISAEARENIFERFYRADSARDANVLHAGIGLALVKGYVDLMEGKIDLESELGVGTTFHIRLPVRENGSMDTKSN